jgi:hypothetical protein
MNAVALNWTLNEASSYFQVNEDDKRFQHCQWFDRILTVYLLNFCMI